ncbi:MAG: hypothetical protein WD317_09950 [Balneolaceae bacterium]
MNKFLRLYRIQLYSFLKSDRGKTTVTWSRRILNAVIFVWLFYELSSIGWRQIWNSFPTQLWFYILFLISFFQLPAFEIWMYRITWVFNSVRSFPVFLIKKIYNKDVLGYSGEIYFYIWARKHLNISDREIFMIIKDNNIISSVASTLVAFGVLAILLFTGQVVVLEWIMDQGELYFWAGLGVTLILVFLFIRFRHFVLSMSLQTAYKIFSIQVFRLLLLKVLNILMFVIVLPEVGLSVWFTFLAIEIILTRIPFLPNRDLIFVGISVGLAQGLMVSQTDIAGIMVAKAALGKLLNVAAFGLAGLAKKGMDIPEEKGAVTADTADEKEGNPPGDNSS